MSPFELLFCALLILTSAFLSSSEIALFSLSRFHLRFLKDQVQPATYRNIKRLIQDPGGLLITILVLNEVVNILLSSLITKFMVFHSGSSLDGRQWILQLILSTLTTTF